MGQSLSAGRCAGGQDGGGGCSSGGGSVHVERRCVCRCSLAMLCKHTATCLMHAPHESGGLPLRCPRVLGCVPSTAVPTRIRGASGGSARGRGTEVLPADSGIPLLPPLHSLYVSALVSSAALSAPAFAPCAGLSCWRSSAPPRSRLVWSRCCSSCLLVRGRATARLTAAGCSPPPLQNFVQVGPAAERELTG